MNTEPKTRALMERALQQCDARKLRRALLIAQKRYAMQGEWGAARVSRRSAGCVQHQIRGLRRLIAEAKADGRTVNISVEDVTVSISSQPD